MNVWIDVYILFDVRRPLSACKKKREKSAIEVTSGLLTSDIDTQIDR